MAKMYSVYAREMDGNSITGFYVRDTATGEERKFTKEQMAFMVGAKRVVNCTGQINDTDVIFRGIGFELRSLPVIGNDGTVKMGAGGEVLTGPRGVSAEQIASQYAIVACVISGKNTVGYILRDRGGHQAFLTRDKVIAAASQKKISNATTQLYNGTQILRGRDSSVRLTDLPTMSYDEALASGYVRR